MKIGWKSKSVDSPNKVEKNKLADGAEGEDLEVIGVWMSSA